MVRISAITAAGLALLGSVSAHPGEVHKSLEREIALRDRVAALGARSLSKCSNSEGAQQLKARAVERRAKKLAELRARQNIKTPARKVKRNFDTKFKRDQEDIINWEAINHNLTGSVSYDMFTPIETVFSANTSCILAPETTGGPYYIVGEYMRSNVIETEHCDGVPLFLEVQYVDVATCDPVPAMAVDVWNCNATGVYSGVVAAGNTPDGGYDSTFLRGVQLTDHDGVVQFETIFPGHYSGRATHVHLLSHTNATLQANGTISVWDAPVSHIGQLFFPETLRQEVEANEPYASNTVAVTTNEADMWSIVQADASYDPFPEFVYLGDDVSAGLFAWIQIGINATADYSEDGYYGVAGYLAEDGGHGLDSGIGPGNGGGGNGTFPGNGTAPTGIPPDGTAGAPAASATA